MRHFAIAHGFLTLSLLPMITNSTITIDNVKLGEGSSKPACVAENVQRRYG